MKYADVGERVRLLKRGRWRVRVNGRNVLVVVSWFRIWAFEATCPHRGLPLDGCVVRGTAVTCPFHGRKFDLRDGHPLPSRGNPLAGGDRLTVLPVIRKGARLLVGLPSDGDRTDCQGGAFKL